MIHQLVERFGFSLDLMGDPEGHGDFWVTDLTLWPRFDPVRRASYRRVAWGKKINPELGSLCFLKDGVPYGSWVYYSTAEERRNMIRDLKPRCLILDRQPEYIWIFS